ncbi:MAG: sulfide/dihydroorotate dehydrogenase-like FAD/NAD-binding protein [Euryarchaeota archaeon]|nr:sulfide/dihydroorotate dehydrogenase-like FAD/NAD-binding protein [Euryarchaeota archaeon]
MTRIIERREVAPNVHRLIVEAPQIAEKVRPGQFVIVMPDEEGERVPISVAEWDAKAGSIVLFFLEVGVSTMKLARKEKGEDLYAVVGPLGRPATIGKFGTVVLGGGCYGIGAITAIAKAMKEAGNRVIAISEGRSRYLLYNQDTLRRFVDECLEATTDGSAGKKGKVQDVLRDFAKREKVDMAYFVGCTFMMMRCAETAKELGIKTLVALNSLMLDGTGMCGVCRVSVGGKTRFACVDGPEFDGHDVDWLELFQRKAIFVRDEVTAYQFHACRALRRHEGGD